MPKIEMKYENFNYGQQARYWGPRPIEEVAEHRMYQWYTRTYIQHVGWPKSVASNIWRHFRERSE